ncbi:MAG: TraR/DksA family transcriptional regulator [Anaerolineae bacterium]
MTLRSDKIEAERKSLEAERQEIVDDIEHLREALLGEVDIDADEGDPDLGEREKNLALLTVMERKLESINNALRAIEKGRYGMCERCGNPIDPARLEVRPDATLCLDCQREVERITRRAALRYQEDE